MRQIRGIITAPSADSALAIEDGCGPARRQYAVRYANCEPPADAQNRLIEGEMVVFSLAEFDSGVMGAVAVKRVSKLPLDGLVGLTDALLLKGDKIHGRRSTYTLRRCLTNRGAAGLVWEAEDFRRKETVALKFFAPSAKLVNYGQVANVCERFKREAEQGQRLHHKNIVRYLDAGEHLGLPFVCMEFCHRGTLSDEIKARPLTLQKTLLVVRQMAEALSYMHATGVIHRDIKPPNILHRGDGSWCLGDLGIVQLNELLGEQRTADRLTKSSVQLGSWQYMAPEQCENPAQITELVDVYALGASWFEMLTGRPPLREHIAAKKIIPPIPTSSTHGQLLMRMLSYDPANRPSVNKILSTLTREPPFNVSDVESVVRDGLNDQGHPDVVKATITVTAKILPMLGAPRTTVNRYLASYGYKKPPKFHTEDGALSRDLPEDVLNEISSWITDELLEPEVTT